MPNKLFFVITIFLLAVTSVFAANDPVETALAKHFSAYKDKEYFSGMAVAVYKPGQPIKNYVIGQTAHDAASEKVTTDTLFQIGSITKSFTAAIMLQLEKEKKAENVR